MRRGREGLGGSWEGLGKRDRRAAGYAMASGCQEDAAGDGAAAGGHDGDLGAGYLPGASGAAKLQYGLVDDPVAVHAPGGELAAVGVERQVAVEGDALAALDEGSGLALAAQAECLEPRDGEE